VPASDIHRVIDAVWRIESARVIGGLARIVRDVGVAEDLAQDALVAALKQWPESGVPDNPAAWLMGAAKHRAIDHLRRKQLLQRKHGELAYEIESSTAPDFAAALDDDVGDGMLRLMFTACHPVLSAEARVALTLRMVGGLATDEIARAFLVPEATMAQRIVRAKKTLAAKRVPFELPKGEERRERLASVLEVIYLIFNEGYAATSGANWMRAALCEDALRLARMAAELAPEEAEAHGLAALLEIQASRSQARVGPDGQAILLSEQNRSRWNQLLIRRGLASIARADRLGAPGPYAIQARIAACHATAATFAETDWNRIVSLYDALLSVLPTPVVALNRAVAVGMAAGPQAGLDAVDAISGDASLQSYHLLPGVRGEMLAKLGRGAEARAEFERAAAMTRNDAERAVLIRKAETAGSKDPASIGASEAGPSGPAD
jgi:RNA polymerase sigma factor (sigma-70 family)